MKTVDELLTEGIALHQAGQPERAEALYRAALGQDPGHMDGLHLLGVCLRRLGRAGEGAEMIRRALALRPNFTRAWINLGHALRDLGRPADSARAFAEATRLEPLLAEAWRLLGAAEVEAGRAAEALAAFDRAIALDAQDAGAHGGRAMALAEDPARQEEAVAAFRRSLQLNPGNREVRHRLGISLVRLGRRAEAAGQCFGPLAASDPDDWMAAYLEALGQFANIYDDERAMDRAREAYAGKLRALAQRLAAASPRQRAAAAASFFSECPFLVPYQGRNERGLMELWGGMMCDAMAALFPNAAEAPPMPPVEGRIRVGVLSAHLYRHSNWKIPIRGWVENLDKSRFHLTAYYNGTLQDNFTDQARTAFDDFVTGLPRLEDWVERIRADRPHVLLIPEIGMHGPTAQLAALKLAPVQAGSWGHPNTSGLRTMDYFLSSDLMEPEDAQDWYSETLVRLPGLSIHYTPSPVGAAPYDLGRHGVREDAVRYLCVQYLSKYLPRHDWVFPRIAQRVPQAQFLFIGGREEVESRFLARLGRAFAAHGLDAARHVVMLPRLSTAHYAFLNQSGHVFLDCLDWSGCNTTLEALAQGVPVVCADGPSMRARHSAAMLRMMGLGDWVQADAGGVVDLAVRLGSDEGLRGSLAAEMRARAPLLHRDPAPVRALEEFLERVVSTTTRR